MDRELIRNRMKELAENISYEYEDITWLEKAMYCKIIAHKAGGGKNRDNYSNGQMAALGNAVLKQIVAEELFDKGLSLGEVDKHKNRPQDYEVLFHIDWENKIYRFAYDDFGDYYELKGGVHPPLPAHDLYIEAIVGAIYKDRGYDYTRQWVIRFFERNGLKIGETPIYVNKTQRQNTQ